MNDERPNIAGPTSLTSKDAGSDLSIDQAAEHFANELGIHEDSYTPEKPKANASDDWRRDLLHLQPPEVFAAIERDLGPAKALEARKVAELQREAHEVFLREEAEKLHAMRPELKRPEVRAAVAEYMKECGYGDDEVAVFSNFSSARDVALVYDAWKASQPRYIEQPELPRTEDGKFAQRSKSQGRPKSTGGREHFHHKQSGMDQAQDAFMKLLGD